MIFTISLAVRDYECDLQGIVNNAVYQNYFEHARHQYLLANGLDFHDFVKQGINFVIIKAEIDYLRSLTSGLELTVSVKCQQISKLKLQFEQEINILIDSDTVISSQAIFTVVALDKNQKLLKLIDTPIAKLFN